MRCIVLNDRGTMSRFETDQVSSQDDLPPEIQRRLQVEELWARRIVLADLMNAERLQVYAQRCTDLAAGCAPVGAGSRDTFTRLAATVVPKANRKFPAPVARPGAGLESFPQSANHAQPH
jgi:hypothetical protein